jgi:hypothetical protein
MKADRGFALTRCWREGDSNCRSSLLSLYSEKPCVAADFNGRVIPKRTRREVFSDAIHRHGLARTSGSNGSPGSKRPKRDRRFESPLLHQRGTAKRRSDPSRRCRLVPRKLLRKHTIAFVATADMGVIGQNGPPCSDRRRSPPYDQERL